MSAEDLGILLRCHWVYDEAVYAHERQRVQMALLMLFSAFTRIRPGVLLPQSPSAKKKWSDGEESADHLLSSDQPLGVHSTERLEDRKPHAHPRRSDLPDYMGIGKRPRTVCYGDINLFLHRNPEGSDVWVAEVEFVNLKGLKEGKDK